MVCRRMLCGTGVFSGDAGTRRQIAAYRGATQAVSSTRSDLPRQDRNGLFLAVGQQGQQRAAERRLRHPGLEETSWQ